MRRSDGVRCIITYNASNNNESCGHYVYGEKRESSLVTLVYALV